MTEYSRYRRSAIHLAELDSHVRGASLHWARRSRIERMWVRGETRAAIGRLPSDMPAADRRLLADVDGAIALANLDAPQTFQRKEMVGRAIVTYTIGALVHDIAGVDRGIGHHVAAARECFDALIEIIAGDRGAVDFNDHLDVLYIHEEAESAA